MLDANRIVCDTPVFTLADAARHGFSGAEGLYELPFTVSLNAQQFTPRTPLLTYAPPAQSNTGEAGSGTSSNSTAELIVLNTTERAANFSYIGLHVQVPGVYLGVPYNLPTSGPSHGNTTLVVYGAKRDLTGGSLYQCKIGPYVLNATFLPEVAGRGCGILCVTELMDVGTYPVEVSLNGQQFTNSSRDGSVSPRQFVVYDPPVLADTFPRSGPSDMSFHLRLSGTALSKGSDYVCRFAHADTLLGFDYVAASPLTNVSNATLPDSDDVAGLGAVVNWGTAPDSPLPPPCCSQLSPTPCLGDSHSCTSATFVSDTEVRCATPRVALPRQMTVRLTLNGQQYASGAPKVLVYPTPTLQYQTPPFSSGVGGTSVLIEGTNFMPIVSANGGLAASGLPSVRCAFGAQKVPATALSATTVRCFTPPAGGTGAFNEIRLDSTGRAGNTSGTVHTQGASFGNVTSRMLELGTHGCDGPRRAACLTAKLGGLSGMRLPSYVYGQAFGLYGFAELRHLNLTSASPFVLYDDALFRDGRLMLTRSLRSGGVPNKVGFSTLRREAFFSHPQRSFLFDFDLRMGGFDLENGGDGFAISYGDLPSPPQGIGERGVGMGLRILFRTYVHDQLSIMWRGNVVHTLDVATLRTPRPGESAHVHIRLSRTTLDLWYRGVRLIHSLPCPWFLPQPEWTWVFSARAGQRADDHFVSNFTMRSSHSLDDIGAVELRVSLNDQDYTQGFAPFHTYYARPSLTALADACAAPPESSCPHAFSPTSGPTSGGTRVRVFGTDFDHGAAYTCRFGNAPYPFDPYPSDRSLHYSRLAHMVAGCSEHVLNTLLPSGARGEANTTCVAPPAVAVPYLFDPYADHNHVNASGTGGMVTKTVVRAAFVPVGMGGDITCISPASNVSALAPDAVSVVGLEASLNAQDYTANQQPFTFYAPPRVVSLSPSSGPLEGGTLVLISGGNLTGGSEYRCAFGHSTLPVRAEPYNASDATLYCRSPAHPNAPRMATVEVSLNAQQYTRDRILFSVHSPVQVDVLSPATGPSVGATVLTVLGGPFANGTDYRCRFGPFGPTSAGVPVGAPEADYWRVEAVPATVYGVPVNSSAMLCVAPAVPRMLRAHVEVTLNGQQYTQSRIPFEFTEPDVVVSLVSPTTGPLHGMTQLVVYASGIRLGAAYCCRLSTPPDGAGINPFAQDATPGIVMPAVFAPAKTHTLEPWTRVPGMPATSAVTSADAIVCSTPDLDLPDMTNQTLTPAAATASLARQGLPLYVTVSSNCQQYAAPSDSVRFAYYGAPPKIPQPPDAPLAPYRLYRSVSPSAGPSTGSTNVTIVGGPFLNGSDYRCRFAPLMVMVPATSSADGTLLHCQSPAVSRVKLDEAINTSVTVTAAFASATSASRAVAPAAAGLLEVTLNGQQYHCGGLQDASCRDLKALGQALRYQTYSDPRVSQLSPASGPASGGTVLSVYGHGLSSGSHRLCRFKHAALVRPHLDTVGATSDASVSSDGSLLRCLTPGTASSVTQPSTVEVTLNGQQHTSDAARFDFFLPPVVSAVYPLSGPTAGGTQLLLTGTGFHDFGSVSAYPAAKLDLRCRFGEDFAQIRIKLAENQRLQKELVAKRRLTAAETDEQLQRDFDGRRRLSAEEKAVIREESALRSLLAHGREVLAPTTLVSLNGVRCLAPPLASLGGGGTLSFDFSVQPNASALMGAAKVSDGVLKLTSNLRNQVGAFAVRPHAHVELIRDFDASFELLIAGGTSDPDDPAQLSLFSRGYEPLSGMGIAFCFAPVDTEALTNRSFDQYGPEPPRGLRVSLLTFTSRMIEVAYDNVTLARIPLTMDLRTLSWTSVRIRYEATDVLEGAYRARGGRGLSVWYDGVEHVSNLSIPNWAPAHNWSWSLSAATYDATDLHWVDNLQITSANLSLADSYPVALTLNRREYYPTNGATYAYAPPPVLSSVLPASGPRAGGTLVTLYGTNLANGTHYKCRWGGPEPAPALGGRVLHGPVPGSLPLEQYMTPATYVGAVGIGSMAPAPPAETARYGQLLRAGAVACVSPNVTAISASEISLELSLNGQEYTRQGLTFTRYAPVLTSVYPLTGPRSGGFRIELGGSDLANGSDYRCRFEFPTDAPWAGGTSRWPSPPPPSEAGSGEEGSGSGDSSSGASLGRRLSVNASSGEQGSDGMAATEFLVVPAELIRDASSGGRKPFHDAIVCQVPSRVSLPQNASTGELHVAVSLNAQQYTSSVELDSWWPPSTARLDLYGAPTATSISPSTGPALGGTHIAVSGTNLTGGSNYTCRFGDSAFVAHSQQPLALPGTLASSGDYVRCVSPPFELKSCFKSSLACDPRASRADALDVSPNGQDYMPRLADVDRFVRFREPILLAVSPNTGPSAGGTLVILSGVLPTLGGGSDYRCRFVGASIIPSPPSPPAPPSSPSADAGSGDGAASGEMASGEAASPPRNFTHVSSTVPASFDASSGSVRCYTPSLGELTATLLANFTVSLNGQQYHGVTAAETTHLTFDFFGAPTLSAVSPSCGPTGGATRLTISGEQLGRGSHYLCRFGERAGAARIGARPLRIDASTAARYETAAGSISCLTPPGLHEVPFLYLEVSLNGQESTMSPLRIIRYRPPALASLSPASGPTDGSTVIDVTGNHSLNHMLSCDVRCAFGDRATIVPGTLPSLPGLSGTHGPTGTMRCESPPNVPAGPLEVSLNGQQYTHTHSRSSVHFAPYAPPSILAVQPPLGIANGNTMLLLPMANYSQAGTDMRCRFGSKASGAFIDVPASYHQPPVEKPSDDDGESSALSTVAVTPLSQVLASVMPPSLPPPLTPAHIAGGVLRCVVPPRAIGVDELRITLNGQQFSPPQRYDVLTAPRVSSLYPLASPERGGVLITVHGQGFAAAGTVAGSTQPGDAASGEVASGDASVSGSGESASGEGSQAQAGLIYDPELLRCRVGAASVRATLLNDTAVTCLTPSGGLAGVSTLLSYTFDGPTSTPHAALIYGDARISSGALLLTHSVPDQHGAFLFQPPTLHGRLPASEGGPFPTAFRLSLNLSIGTGFPLEPKVTERTGGDGLAISIGELPSAPAGELGAGNGLRVCLRTRANVLSVDYGTRSLLAVPLPDAERLRSNVSFPLVLTLRNRSLTLMVGNRTALDRAPLHEWGADAHPSWRFGLSARTNPHRGENHWVHAVRLELGPSLETARSRVEVTANGQQFSSDGAALLYFGDTKPTVALPPLGPPQGETRVVVRGAALHGGSAYSCRFGSLVVPASFETSDESVRCVAPSLAEALAAPAGAAGPATPATPGLGSVNLDGSGRGAVTTRLALSLNEQDYESAIPTTLAYSYYALPRILAVSPQAGPVRGHTRVTLVVDGLPDPDQALASGSNLECKFGGSAPVAASLTENVSLAAAYTVPGAASVAVGNTSGRVITCITPASTEGAQPLYVSLNSQQYLSDGSANFTFYMPPTISAMLPAGGPRHGGTEVRVVGRGLTPDATLREPALCRFGRAEVAAVADEARGELTCVAPSARSAGGDLHVAVLGGAEGSPGDQGADGIDMVTPHDDGPPAETTSPAVGAAGEVWSAGELQCDGANCTLTGMARRVGSVLRLTNGFGSGQLTVVPSTTSPQTALHTWEATFSLSVLGAEGGVALSVGGVPSVGLGATGGGAQLRVMLRPGMVELAVSWEGDVLAAVPLPPPRTTPSNATSARVPVRGVLPPTPRVARIDVDARGKERVEGAAWRDVRLALLEDGLHVSIDGAALLSGLSLPGYAAQLGWRLALSAAAGEGYGRLWVRKLRLRTDAGVYNATLPVALSLNGQQYSPAAESGFEYTAHPTVVSVEPRSGPVHGGTRVLISGLAFADGGSAHRCRFGGAGASLVNATRHAGTGLLACTTPPSLGAVSGRVNVSVELMRHGQLQVSEGHEQGVFVYTPALSAADLALSPLSGPMGGGASLLLATELARGVSLGADDMAMLAPRCRFDLREQRIPARESELMRMAQRALLASPVGFNASESVLPALTLPATLTPANGLMCIAPRIELPFARLVSGEGAALPIAISLNAQQYVDLPSPLAIYEPPRLDMVSPACGPVDGGTTLTIVGSQLSGGSAYRCRLGPTEPQSTASASASAGGGAGGGAGAAAFETVAANYTASPQGELIICTVPNASRALAAPTSHLDRWSAWLNVTLNGQQYHHDDLGLGRLPPGTARGFKAGGGGFVVYASPPPEAHAVPRTVRGGHAVTIFGPAFAAGCAFACRFAGAEGGEAVAPGTYDRRRGSLRCMAPARPTGTAAEVEVSLNGQQFMRSGANVTWE